MEFGALKPVLTALAMPPASLLLLAALGLWMARRKWRGGWGLTALSVLLLAVLSCHGTAVWLARQALPQFPPLTLQTLQTSKVQAIVVLGGGALPDAPEYGDTQPNAHTAARLRYGVWLARQSGLPVAFSGGHGWAAHGQQARPEADVAARTALQDYGLRLRWIENRSRDTHENALMLAPLLQRDGVQRIALVTDASHMPRAVQAFERTDLVVQAAPVSYTLPQRRDLLEWIPSASGMLASRQVLHEVLALWVGRLIPV